MGMIAARFCSCSQSRLFVSPKGGVRYLWLIRAFVSMYVCLILVLQLPFRHIPYSYFGAALTAFLFAFACRFALAWFAFALVLDSFLFALACSMLKRGVLICPCLSNSSCARALMCCFSHSALYHPLFPRFILPSDSLSFSPFHHSLFQHENYHIHVLSPASHCFAISLSTPFHFASRISPHFSVLRFSLLPYIRLAFLLSSNCSLKSWITTESTCSRQRRQSASFSITTACFGRMAPFAPILCQNVVHSFETFSTASSQLNSKTNIQTASYSILSTKPANFLRIASPVFWLMTQNALVRAPLFHLLSPPLLPVLLLLLLLHLPLHHNSSNPLRHISPCQQRKMRITPLLPRAVMVSCP